MSILETYEKATRQKVNLQKSAITFGKKVDVVLQTQLKGITGIEKEGGTGTYLGLPECFSGSKTEMLAYIHDRLKSRLSGWFARLLSQGGKEILIKAVAMAMPVYAMSCFKLTKKSCENLNSAMADFWWNSLEHKRKIHWLSWTKLCLAKEQGGLGFKDIQCFNQALLAKQAWRLVDQPESLFVRVFKSRCFPGDTFLDAAMGYRPSYAWRSIQFGKEFLVQGIRKEVGNGKTFSVWVDPWIKDGRMRRPVMKNIFVDLSLKVSELIDVPNKRWNLNALEDLFYPEVVERIFRMKPLVDHEDYWVWVHNKWGGYSVKSGYWMINKVAKMNLIEEAEMEPSINGLKASVWKVKTASNIKTFMWKALSNTIPVGELIAKRGVKLDPVCQSCGSSDESVNHLLFSCDVARQVCAMSDVPAPENGFNLNSFYSNFHFLLLLDKIERVPVVIKRSFPWILWFLWKNRNGILFEGKSWLANEIIVKARDESEMWFLAQEAERVEYIDLTKVLEVRVKVWERPPISCIKCNVGCKLDNKKKIGGAAWVVRDEMGVVKCHSRRSFLNVSGCQDLCFKSLLWAIESMVSMRRNRVRFAFEDAVSYGLVTRPRAWPSFKAQAAQIKDGLAGIEWWRVLKEGKKTNRGPFLIAKSVPQGLRLQSYVAVGYPVWMKETFESERVLPSV